MADKSKIWGGRFQSGPSGIAERISESISFDHVLYDVDIRGSIAHVNMLERCGILSEESSHKITDALRSIHAEIEQNGLEFSWALEDIHMHIEKILTDRIGDDGKRMHTGRSRNDQVAVDTHLYLKETIEGQSGLLLSVMKTILEMAEKYRGKIWAGYTHLQIAQPVLLSHYILSWFWKFARDFQLMQFAYSETCQNPLGAAAMGGPNYPVDPDMVREELGFGKSYENSMDAVSNRDYQLSYHFFASRLSLHISRFCEDMIIYNTSEFATIRFSDAVTTGSSIMPQKKNPDIAEILRSKSARITGNLNSLMMNLKGLPTTYNRDLQDDKVYLFDTIKNVTLILEGMKELLTNVIFFPDKLQKNLEAGFGTATDVADYLVAGYHLPFRDAHHISGAIVAIAEQKRVFINQISPADIATILKPFEDKYNIKINLNPAEFTVEKSVSRRGGSLSTSPEMVERQMDKARKLLEEIRLTCF